jgi:hypothetical protein
VASPATACCTPCDDADGGCFTCDDDDEDDAVDVAFDVVVDEDEDEEDEDDEDEDEDVVDDDDCDGATQAVLHSYNTTFTQERSPNSRAS